MKENTVVHIKITQNAGLEYMNIISMNECFQGHYMIIIFLKSYCFDNTWVYCTLHLKLR